MKTLECRHCNHEFALYLGKPGLIDECPGCAVEPEGVETIYASGSEDLSGAVNHNFSTVNLYESLKDSYKTTQKKRVKGIYAKD